MGETLELVPKPDAMLIEYLKLDIYEEQGQVTQAWKWERIECPHIEACTYESGALHIEFFRKGESEPFEMLVEAPGTWRSLRLSVS